MSHYSLVALGEFLVQESNFEEVKAGSFYETAGIYSYGRGLFKRPKIDGGETSYSRYNRLRVGQFVYSKLFAWEGALAVVSESFDGLYVSHEFPTFRVDESKANIAYVAYVAGWQGLHFSLRGKTTGMGSRRQRVNIDQLLSVGIPLPSLDEQLRVVSRLDAAFNRINCFLQGRSISDAALGQIFGSGLRSCLHWAPLGEALKLAVDEVEVSPEETYRIAGVFGQGRGVFARGAISGSETSYKKLHRIHSGSLVMSRLKAFEGAISLVAGDFDGWFLSPEFPTFVAREERATMDYIKHLCSWPDFWRMLRGESKGLGARRERVTASRLLSIQVPLPDLEEQKIFADRLDRLERVKGLFGRQEETSKALKASLLDAAFNGRL